MIELSRQALIFCKLSPPLRQRAALGTAGPFQVFGPELAQPSWNQPVVRIIVYFRNIRQQDHVPKNDESWVDESLISGQLGNQTFTLCVGQIEIAPLRSSRRNHVVEDRPD